MTSRQYKLVLLCFLFIFVLFAGSRYIIKGSNLIVFILVYSFGLLYWLLLFCFLLYARKRGITEEKNKISPAKLLPIVTAWIALISVLYPLTMVVIYKTVNTVVYRRISPEAMLARTQKAANDTTKTAEQRLKAAQFYYKYSGERIIYTDENDRKKEYLPDDSANQARLKHLEVLKQQSFLYRFMVASSVLSLLSGLTVGTIYFRTQKNYRQENFT